MGRLATLTLLLTLTGCASEHTEYDIDEIAQSLDNQGNVTLTEKPRGTKLVMSARDEQELIVKTGGENRYAFGTTLIYMNKEGAVFTPGQNDASANRSTLVAKTVSVPPADLNGQEWNEVMSCMHQLFSRFDVEITDIDPGEEPHIESVIGGAPRLLGLGDAVAGIAPFTSGCDFIPNAVVFTFADILAGDPRTICEIAAQEVAHSFGLDHEYLCSDPMTYLTDCGDKGFQDELAECGENFARRCAVPNEYDCGYSRQNSVQLLLDRVGGNLDPIPRATIIIPVDGGAVTEGFEVETNVGNATQVEFWIDNEQVDSQEVTGSERLIFIAPKVLINGPHELEIVAIKDGDEARDSVSVILRGSTVTGESDSLEPSAGCNIGQGAKRGMWPFAALGLFLWFFRRQRKSPTFH